MARKREVFILIQTILNVLQVCPEANSMNQNLQEDTRYEPPERRSGKPLLGGLLGAEKFNPLPLPLLP
jgi:hypothetical protein